MTSLDKAMAILEALAAAGRLGIKELAGRTGLPPSTVHRVLSALAGGGYVRQDQATRQYHLSLKLLELGARVRADLDLADAARTHMRQLAKDSGETVNLVMFDGGEVVYVDQEACTRSMLRMFTRVGGRAPLYCSGVGKAFLARLGDGAALEYFGSAERMRHTERTIVREGPFLAEMAAIRARGYALDNEEMEAGVRCVAALILRAGGSVAGAMSLSGPSARLTQPRLRELSGPLLEAARAVSRELGCAEYRPFEAAPAKPLQPTNVEEFP